MRIQNNLVINGVVSDYYFSIQDGSGRIQNYWNSTRGPDSENKYLISNEESFKLDLGITRDPYYKIKHAGKGDAGEVISWNEHFVIKQNGNIGIGKANPTSKLDVSGSINFSGNLTKDGNALNLSDFITDATIAAEARTALGVDAAGTDNSTNVTLANTSYLSISDQEITGGTVPVASGGTGSTSAPMVGLITAADVAAVKTLLSYGNLAALDSVAAGQIDANAVDSSELKDGSIDESHLNVTNAAGSATDNYLLSYNHAGSNFTWVAPVSSGIALSDLSASNASASGSGGSLAYNNTNGAFTFTPAFNIAGNSATSTVTANNSTDENNYLTFAANNTASGSLGLETDTALYFNPALDTLYVPYVSATNLTASNLISAVNGINITGNSQGISLSGTNNFIKTDNLTNDTALLISTTSSNSSISLSPHGDGNVTVGTDSGAGLVNISSPIHKTGVHSTLTETAHTSTASDPASASSGTYSYAQKRGITKIQGRISPLSNALSNGSNVSITILPSGTVSGSNCSYRGIRGTIHMDAGISGSGNFVLTQDFIANDRDGTGTYAFVSSNVVFEGRTDFPFKISWAEITSDDMQLKIENNTGGDIGTTLTIWWDLTLFPEV